MKRAVLVAALLAAGAALMVTFFRSTQHDVRTALRDAQSWGYQLQRVDVETLAATDLDVLVIDHSLDGTAGGRLTPEAIESLKTKPDGSRRVVLSYLSIGEAEVYRSYWQPRWLDAPPPWLGEENPDWPGNYAVAYEDAEWQALIFGEAAALLDIILAQGFDGVYLDRVDAYYGRGDDARAEMMTFVAALARYGRARDDDFLVVQQNAEALVANPAHRAVIDGLAKEDLYFGVDGEAVANPQPMVADTLGHLDTLIAAGKPVFVVEYGLESAARQRVRAEAQERGYVVTFAPRPLDAVPEE